MAAWYTTIGAGAAFLVVAVGPGWAAPTDFLGSGPTDEPSGILTSSRLTDAAETPPEPIIGGAATEAQTWREFLRQRTRWGIGAEERYLSNVFMDRGASRQRDMVTTAESQVAFADPRGDWLYGGSYEMNSLHYHDLGEHPFTHEFRAYTHYTPLGRYQLALTEKYEVNQRLTGTVAQTDAIRRFRTVTEERNNEVELQGTYDLDATNAVRTAYNWTWEHDKAPDAASVNHDTHQVTLGMDHDVTRRLTLFGGYTVADTTYGKTPDKDVFAHGLDLEARYDLDPTTTTRFITTLVERDPAAGKRGAKVNLKWVTSRLLSPRTRWVASVSQQTLSSVTASTGSFTSQAATWQMTHALTPRVSATWQMAYEHVSTATTRSDRVAAALEFTWQLRPNVSGVLGYHYQTLNQDNIQDHQILAGVEAQLW